MSRAPASDRVRRLLALVPWVAANSPVTVTEVCQRFGIDKSRLLAELEVLSYVGVPPYTPDTMISVDIDNDVIDLRLAQPFDRPLRLTPTQALALIAAGQSISAVPGADPGDPLQRALAKVADVLGVDPQGIQIELGDVERVTLDRLSDAADQGQQVEIGYFTHGRNEYSTRVVNPHKLYASHGNWYLLAWCHQSADTRVFRVDRIDQLKELGVTFEPPVDVAYSIVFRPAETDPRVILELEPSAYWVVEQYPSDSVEETEDGTYLVRLAVTARPWLERLLVGLGPAAHVREAEADLADAGASAALRIIQRYEDN